MSNSLVNSNGGAGARRDASVQDPNTQISQKLRQLYDSVQEEEIPDRFLDLLEKLDAAESAAMSHQDGDR